MVNALGRELQLQKEYFGNEEEIKTIYFGGGTPSLLSEEHIKYLLKEVRDNFSVIDSAEITLEANPDDFSKSITSSWSKLGINRLSIGIQSFNNKVLKYMNRVHNSQEAEKAIELARAEGIDNLNVDLIYGVAASDHSRWKSDLDKALDQKPDHISAYCLTIEENTVFGNWKKKGKLKEVEDSFAAEEYQILTSKLKGAGYIHYEISNFCLPGRESKHNAAYWQDQKYLGIGPSAHSYNGLSRQFNIANNARYIQSIESDKIPAEIENLSRLEKINDYLLTTLRTHWGASLNTLQLRWSYDLKAEKTEYLKELEKNGYCSLTDDRITLTEKGFLLADQITSELIIEN